MVEATSGLYIGLKCQHCGQPIMGKNHIDHISDAFRDAERIDSLKTHLSILKCRECGKNVSDQVIWNFKDLLARESSDWTVKTSEEVWPYETKSKPYKFGVHKSGGYGVFMSETEEGL